MLISMPVQVNNVIIVCSLNFPLGMTSSCSRHRISLTEFTCKLVTSRLTSNFKYADLFHMGELPFFKTSVNQGRKFWIQCLQY